MRRRPSRFITSLVIASTLGLAGVVAVPTTSYAADQIAFEATGTGAIPDGTSSACPSPGANLDLTFNVSGIPVGAALSDVRVANLRLTHTWMGDVTATLIAPDASQVVLFGRTGVGPGNSSGDSSDLAGPYRFTDRAGGQTWWQAAQGTVGTQAVPSGYYRASTAGSSVGGGGTPVSITGAFAGLANANGTWILRFTDSCSPDTGVVTQASLQLEVASQRCASMVAAVGAAQDAYTASQAVAGNASLAVSDATDGLITAQNARTTAVSAVASAKTAFVAARTAAQQARTTKDSAADAVIAADGALARATQTLTKAQATVAKATSALATAKKSGKKAAVVKATKALKKAQQAQKAATTKVKAATGVLKSAKTALTSARQAATTKEQALQAADDALDEARDTLDQAQVTLATVTATYTDLTRAEALALAQMDVAMLAIGHAEEDLFDCTDE
jgi:subtilisin-like proprotein convertase family protein